MTLRVPVGRSEAFVIVKVRTCVHVYSVLMLWACTQVKDSSTFERDGYDIHSDAVVSFTQAALGGEVRVQGLNGPMNVKVRMAFDVVQQ